MKDKLNEILENMIDMMGEGGMDISYSGHKYSEAKNEAITKILGLVPTNTLEKIFEKQLELQKALGIEFNQDYINVMSLALQQEIHEALRETPWKPWKLNQSFNRENYLKELADALHFFVNLCLAGNITADELYEAYLGKNQENHERKESGY